MTVPVHRREFDVFVSYAHEDRDLALSLREFLLLSGLHVFIDEREIEGGSSFAQTIRRGIERSRGIMIVGTVNAVGQGWVQHEVDVALDEHANDRAFRLIPLRVAAAPLGTLVRATTWIELPAPELTSAAAGDILRAFYPTELLPEPTGRDVYVSASWRASDCTSATAVTKRLRDEGFRLIGDSKDQEGFGEDRITRIIDSCGAFVCVVPLRDGIQDASAADGPYRYFMREVDTAEALGLPSVVVADPDIRRTDGDDSKWVRMSTFEASLPDQVGQHLEDLWDRWRAPAHPHRVFLATDLDSRAAKRGSAERRLIELVTGMPTSVGNEIQADPVQHGIFEQLLESHLVIADISGDDEDSFNIDASIEAGIVLAAGKNLRLMARGKERKPPFMIRGPQTTFYRDEIERIAVLHSFARAFRRRVINPELD